MVLIGPAILDRLMTFTRRLREVRSVCRRFDDLLQHPLSIQDLSADLIGLGSRMDERHGISRRQAAVVTFAIHLRSQHPGPEVAVSNKKLQAPAIRMATGTLHS